MDSRLGFWIGILAGSWSGAGRWHSLLIKERKQKKTLKGL